MTPPYDRPVHTVRVLRDTPLYDLLQTEHMGVNSIHHQAIRKLAPDLREMALSEDGLVEAVYMPGKRFVWAVRNMGSPLMRTAVPFSVHFPGHDVLLDSGGCMAGILFVFCIRMVHRLMKR